MKTTHDITTYRGWLALASELLGDKPDWTALVQGDLGFVVIINGHVCGLATKDEGHIYSERDCYDFDASAWDSERGCWDGSTPEVTASSVLAPRFVNLAHTGATLAAQPMRQQSQVVGDCGATRLTLPSQLSWFIAEDHPAIGLTIEDYFVTDPYYDVGMRDKVDPQECWGLNEEQAKFIVGLNEELPLAVRDAINAGCQRLQKFAGVSKGVYADGHFANPDEFNKLMEVFASYIVGEINSNTLTSVSVIVEKTGVFQSSYEQHAARNGQSFVLQGPLDPATYDADDVGPMYRVKFADGEVIEAWPDEVKSALPQLGDVQEDAKEAAKHELQKALKKATECGLLDDLAGVLHPDAINRFCDAVGALDEPEKARDESPSPGM